MKPGRELDALIAEKVMDIEPWPGMPGLFKAKYVPNYQYPKPCLPPEYSTDIACAWPLVEKLRMSVHAPNAWYAYGEYANKSYDVETERWMAECGEDRIDDKLARETRIRKVLDVNVNVRGETGPHVICKLALTYLATLIEAGVDMSEGFPKNQGP